MVGKYRYSEDHRNTLLSIVPGDLLDTQSIRDAGFEIPDSLHRQRFRLLISYFEFHISNHMAGDFHGKPQNAHAHHGRIVAA
jgi:hypothetical protein